MSAKKYMTLTAAAVLMLSSTSAMAGDHEKMGKMDGMDKAGAYGMMMKADENSDGTVSKNEFMNYHEMKFKSLDKDGDGNITKEEMTSYREEKHEKMREKRFEDADTDGDGKLSKDEVEAHKNHMKEMKSEHMMKKDQIMNKDGHHGKY